MIPWGILYMIYEKLFSRLIRWNVPNGYGIFIDGYLNIKPEECMLIYAKYRSDVIDFVLLGYIHYVL